MFLFSLYKYKSMTEKIMAAGGIVTNEEGAILFMFRRGKWDLPKGKLDEGETLEQCAVREIEEETGLRNVVLGNLIGTTIHHYTEHGRSIEKETHWYSMKASGNQALIPQTEEDISELKWVNKKELGKYLENSYDNIVEIVRRYLADHNITK